jgi:Protein of unknown function (DUF2892)
MAQNLGHFDRLARLLAALPLAACAWLAPFGPAVRASAFGAPALYLVATAFGGVCLGYRLLGKSTCPSPRPLGS